LSYYVTDNSGNKLSAKWHEREEEKRQHLQLNSENPHKYSNPISVNATLPQFMVERIQREVIKELRKPLKLYSVLQKYGLIVPYGNLGTQITSWDRESFMEGAEISMNPHVESNNDKTQYDQDAAPIPVIHKNFDINIRELEASKNAASLRGATYPIDTARMAVASRAVGEVVEQILINGAPKIVFRGQTVFGFLTYPFRNTFTTTDWTSASTAQITKDVREMKQILINNNFYPGNDDVFGKTGGEAGYVLLYSRNYNEPLDAFQTGTNLVQYKTNRDMIELIEGIDGTVLVPFLPDNTVILMKPDRSVVDVAMAQPFSTYQWQNDPTLRRYLVMGAMTPRFKRDFVDQVGYVVGQP